MTMKKLSLLLLAVVSGLLCFAQPKIEFEKTTYDFGKIKEEGGKVTGKFVFKNVGNEPLELPAKKAISRPPTIPTTVPVPSTRTSA